MATSAQAVFPAPKNGVFWSITALLSVVAVSIIYLILNSGGTHIAELGSLDFMPGVNATLNALSASLLVAGVVAVKTRRIRLHRALMTSAFVTSTAFLIGYLGYHFVHGDTRYAGSGTLRTIYLLILGSHVILSMAVVPLVLGAFWFALTKQISRHKRLVKWTLPIWLYVSVTGVLVFFLLRASYTERAPQIPAAVPTQTEPSTR